MGSDWSAHAVIFDMDGVLTDSEPLINAAAVAMFRERSLEVKPEDFHPFVGTGENRYLGGVAARICLAVTLEYPYRTVFGILVVVNLVGHSNIPSRPYCDRPNRKAPSVAPAIATV